MKIGLLTSGGDCPGLNAVIRGAVLKGVIAHDTEFVGFRGGWRGVVEADIMEITRHDVRGLAKQGGTILGSSRTNPFEGEGGGPENIQRRVKLPHIVRVFGNDKITGWRDRFVCRETKIDALIQAPAGEIHGVGAAIENLNP